MNLAERILGALKLGAMTAEQLGLALGVTSKSIRNEMGTLIAGKSVQYTQCAQSHRFGAPPRLYWLMDDKQIQLGSVSTRDVLPMAKRIGELLLEHGEVSVFVDGKRKVRVALHYDAGYAAALAQMVDQLVGRYRRDADEPFRAATIAEDLLHRLAELEQAPRAVA